MYEYLIEAMCEDGCGGLHVRSGKTPQEAVDNLKQEIWYKDDEIVYLQVCKVGAYFPMEQYNKS
jgi:hypothetical protein